MKNKIEVILKNERGAVSVLVFITILTFVIVLLGSYLTVTTMKKTGLQSNIRLQQIYGEDVKRVDEIYNELISKDREGPKCNITYTNTEEANIQYKFEFNEAVKNFEETDIKLYNGSILENKLANTITLSTSSPAYAFNVEKDKKYIISFDYKCISDSQEFEIGLYSETVNNLPTKKITATTEKQHENYKIDVENEELQFKLLSEIQQNNNITLENIQIIEISSNQLEIQEFNKIDNATYIVEAQYDENLKYVILLEENICTDFNGNRNKEKIQIV